MSGKRTWFWLFVAAALFAFIYFYEHGARRHKTSEPVRILPRLNPAKVMSVQVRPAGHIQLEIRADRTNQTWTLNEPFVYPAEQQKIEALLTNLTKLSPAVFITPAELRNHEKVDQEYGFSSPQAVLILEQDGGFIQLNIGSRTAPGDQVFVQVVASEGVYVVDASLLKLVPATADDWRDTTVVNTSVLSSERLAVTNNAKSVFLVMHQNSTNHLWRMVWPFRARADNGWIVEGLRKLAATRIHSFLPEAPKPELDTLGLATPALELALGEGSNNVVLLQIGKSPTNDPGLVYARRVGENAFFTLPADALKPWQRESVNDFRDPHLLTATEPITAISAKADDSFDLRQSNGVWHIFPGDRPGDPELIGHFVSVFTNAPIAQFVKDVVNPPDLPGYGLTPPLREYRLESPGSGTNLVLADVQFGFGTNQADKVFARRTDESSVYALSTNDFAQLPRAGWQLRERKLCNFEASDVTKVRIQRQGVTREVVHNGPHQWSLGPGSSGVINDLAIEETVRGLAQAAMLNWQAHGETGFNACGFDTAKYEITLELKNGKAFSIRFGNETPAGGVYAAVTLDGEICIGEFPGNLYGQIKYSLTVP